MFGIKRNEDKSGEMLLRQKPKIGEEEVSKATTILKKYKDGKVNLEQRVTDDELWYKMRHFEVIRRQKNPKGPNPSSAWLFNTIMNKHADASDNYPEPMVLPRERSDEESAKILSDILPVVMERNGFEEAYSDNWYEKLKHGTAVYGVFWDSEAENGLGDIAIKPISLLNIFWEPGIEDIQKSKYLFVVDLVDREALEQTYPEFAGEFASNTIEVKQYVYDDENVDTSDKAVVVDCYYRVRQPSGRTVLHMMKFCGDVLLFASENEEAYAEGIYAHGEYPVVFDTLFPDKGTPCGFGFVSVCKDPQLYIDALGANILETSLMATKPRYMVSKSSGINIEQFKNWNEQIVEVEGGSLDEAHIRRIDAPQLNGIYASVYDMKINEMKETSGNRDVNSGGSGNATSGVALSVLVETGNKGSRDMISRSYNAYTKIINLCIENMRQFYDEKRTFRIIGENGKDYEFIDFSNERIRDQEMPPAYEGAEMSPDYVPIFRRPIFDIKVRAQKRNPYSQLSMNETAKELYRLGVFNPEKAQESLIMLEMMDFEGIDQVKAKVREGETLLTMLQQMSAQMSQMSALLGMGGGMPMVAPSGGGGESTPSPTSGGGRTVASNVMSSEKRRLTPYGERLAKNARPSMGD